MGYSNKAISGISWLILLRGLIRGLTFARMLVLARILTPAQFGSFGVATLVLSFVEVITETGVNVVLIQEDKKKFYQYLNSAWVVSIMRGIIISLSIVLATPLIVQFFQSPDSLSLLFAISLVPLIKGFINPSIVLFQKDLQFKNEVYFRSIIIVSGTITVLLTAFLLRSPMALIIGMLVEAGLEVILSFIIFKHKPSLSFKKEDFMFVFHRGKWITLAGIFNYFHQQLDDIVVGRKFQVQDLGFYQMAYRLAMLPITEVADVFNKVSFPIYTKISNDKSRLRSAFIKTTTVILLLSAGFTFLISAFPEIIINILLGSQWISIVNLLPILGFTGLIRSITVASYPLFLSLKYQKYITNVTLVSVITLAISIYPFTTWWQLPGAAYSALLATSLALPLSIIYTVKLLK